MRECFTYEIAFQDAAQDMLKTAQDHHQRIAADLQGKFDAERQARTAAESKMKQLHKRVHAWREGYAL